MRWHKVLLVSIGFLFVVSAAIFPFVQASAQADEERKAQIVASLTDEKPFSGLSSTAPTLEKPDWYNDVVIYYSVLKNGSIASDFDEFARLANSTLNDSRGWARMGVRFEQVASGGSFRLILSQASLLPAYSSICSADWSCRAGNNVVINDDRWKGASASWNAAGGSLRDYRHMVVNHEVGHWLGHGHENCKGNGAPAPVMQQQSIDLMGCKFNPWPLESELTTTRF